MRTRSDALTSKIGRPVELPAHRHDEALLVLGLRGTLTMDVAGGTQLVPSETAVWVPAGTMHTVRGSRDHASCVLFIAPEAAPSSLKESQVLRTSPLFRRLVERCAETGARDGRTARYERLAAVVLDELGDVPAGPPGLPMPRDPRLRRIAESLQDDPSGVLGVDDWARRAGMSERTLRRQFHAETGMSFAQWRQRLFVDVARRRIDGGESVKRIAADLGYGSPSAFVAMFKRITSTSPQRSAGNG